MSDLTDDLTTLFNDSVLVMIGRVGAIGGSFLVHTLLVRNLTPESFGILSLGLTIVSVSAGIAMVGMNQTVARFIGGFSTEKANQYVVIGLSTVLVSGTLVSIAVYVSSGLLESFFVTPGLKNILEALTIVIVLRLMTKVVLGIVRGFEMARARTIYHDIVPLLISVPVLYYFISIDMTLTGAFSYFILNPVLRFSLLYVELYRKKNRSLSLCLPERNEVSKLFSFSWPLAFESMVVLFLGSVDILMLGWFNASEAVGFYRSIQPVSKTVIFFIQVLTFIYLPIATQKFEQGELGELDTLYKTATRWISHASFPLVVFYILFGKNFIANVFGDEYVVAWSALAILSIGMYSRVIAGPNGMTIKAIDRTREDLLASIGALCTNVVLNYILIPLYGISGAAVATMFGYVVYNVIDLAIIYRYTGVSPFHVDLITPLVPTAILCTLVKVTMQPSVTSFIGLFIVGICISLVHLASVLLTTGLTQQDMMLIDNLRT